MTNAYPSESPVQASAPLEVGDLAPDFTLVDQYGVDVSLSAVRDLKNAVVVFYPAAFSGICRGELREIRDGLEDFQHDDIQIFAVSCDSMYTLRAWADAEGHFFPLLSDFWPHGEVARRYGVLDDEDGFALRGTFLLDRSGRLVWSEVRGIGQGRDFRAYREALATLRAGQRDAVG
ncbi:peroxiredoxin [Terrabacter aerolatus]|uniref:Alkyl hydroperoxide reductase E n=1 Tax=Terrabacter aerolatus TaxID=422442 RepID=A0A512D6A7_9MICO|nr:peroxiredoxin [Terrabacter aerolatus]GEO31992.1 peroxiredoxin [Terrabacter aerolatus]